MKFFDELEKVLKADERFIGEDNKVIKTKVSDAVRDTDVLLIKALLKSELLRDIFFSKVDDIYVFDKVKFIWVLESKEFLPDSYTLYKNKIGLVDNQNNLIRQKKDISLVWPYKDCVLEGGQTKEDEKRQEVFYNETLAPDEINRLLAPKVLGNAKRYTKNGSEEAFSFQNENLIIKGNNLIALSSLLEKYANQVKLIYIDPPYNTGSDGFGYNDSFSYAAWLTFMKDRLILAKRLLAKDGLIFVSIDSSRQNANGIVGTSGLPYLNVLMDEIFGRKNFIGHLHWKKKKQPSFLSRIAGVMESILVYAKDEKNVRKLQLGTQTDTTTRVDNASNNVATREIKSGIRYMGLDNSVIKKGVYQNKTMSTEFLEDVIIKDGRVQNSFIARAKFRNSQDEITRFCDQDLLYITANNSFRRDKTEDELGAGKTITDLLLDWGQNQDATDELRKLFEITNDEKAFDNPKPELLLANIIESSTEVNDLVLDFFMGSGTTQAVAHKMNRQYIGIDQMDYIQTVALPRLTKVIDGEMGGVSEHVDWKGGGSFVYCELLEDNQALFSELEKATDANMVKSIINRVTQNGKIIPSVLPSELKLTEEEFDALGLEDQKRLVLYLLDKNKLYINLSDIDDEDANVSNADKLFTKSFYGLV
jgi:adenine-specific DNA-methyltransferase